MGVEGEMGVGGDGVLQMCYTYVTIVLQICHIGTISVPQEWYDVSRVINCPAVSQMCYKCGTMVSQVCHKSVTTAHV
jgi:hypothetical protein